MKDTLRFRLITKLFPGVISEHRAQVYSECAGIVDGYRSDAVAMLEEPRILNYFSHAADLMKRSAIGERSQWP